jgi:hypothetical protein
MRIKAAPLRGAAGAPVAGLCAGAPARHERAVLVSSCRSIQLIHKRPVLHGAIFLGYRCPARRHHV